MSRTIATTCGFLRNGTPNTEESSIIASDMFLGPQRFVCAGVSSCGYNAQLSQQGKNLLADM